MVETETKLLMAALIFAVRTAREESGKMQGVSSPRVMGEIAASLWAAEIICRRAVALNAEWFEEADGKKSAGSAGGTPREEASQDCSDTRTRQARSLR